MALQPLKRPVGEPADEGEAAGVVGAGFVAADPAVLTVDPGLAEEDRAPRGIDADPRTDAVAKPGDTQCVQRRSR